MTMTIDEFFDKLAQLPVSWKLRGECIRSRDGTFPSEQYSPLELMCYSKGGTVSWQGSLCKPKLLEFYFQHGQVLGLSGPDMHSLSRMSDNNEPVPGTKDYHTRTRLLQVCRLDRCTKCNTPLPDPVHKKTCDPSCPIRRMHKTQE